jgi:MFS family permease
MFMWSITFFLYVLTGNFVQVLMVRLVIALASCIGDPAWEALFMDYSPREYRGRFMQWQ